MNSNKSKIRCKRGFTLIELLVVVLIIGILAAVALPQYQKAVEKSKAAEALTVLKSVQQAYKVYFLANEKYPTSLEELDIEIPWTGHTKWWSGGNDNTTRSNGDWSLQITNVGSSQSLNIGRISGDYAGAGFAMYELAGDSNNVNPGTISCVERLDGGIAFDKNPGDYCEKLFHATPKNTSAYIRSYTMP